METLLSISVYVLVFSFFGWCLWVTNPRHPDRLARLRKTWGPKK